jgi:hypothetical protein
MSFLTTDQIEALRIEHFIFHVVQHGEDEPILLEETPLGEFEGFFVDRVQDTLKGNQFEFNPGSATFQLLNEISKNPEKFLQNSKQLAINFHAARDGRIKPGVIILMQLFAGEDEFFSLIKYDHEQVLTYSLQNGSRAILEEITNSFTKSKESLHKSALIRLNDEGGDLIVIDKTVQYDITDFFRGFLNVRRKYSESQMTEIVHEVAIKTAVQHRNELPKELTAKIRSISYQAVQSLDIFNPQEFFDKIFGIHGNEKINKTFNTLLKKKNIEGELFKFQKTAIKPPKERKYRTQEGVRIQFGEEAKDTVQIEHGTDTKPTVITITTQQLTEE